MSTSSINHKLDAMIKCPILSMTPLLFAGVRQPPDCHRAASDHSGLYASVPNLNGNALEEEMTLLM